MELLHKLEQKILSWTKSIPHLPEGGRKWLGENVWWMVLIGAIISGISALFMVIGVFAALALIGSVAASYYATSSFAAWSVVTGVVGLVFFLGEVALLCMAIKPLQARQKKGWVILFAYWLVNVVATVVNSVLSLNPFSLVFGLLFGAVWLAITGYFVFEIHGQFAHVEKSRGVKADKK